MTLAPRSHRWISNWDLPVIGLSSRPSLNWMLWRRTIISEYLFVIKIIIFFVCCWFLQMIAIVADLVPRSIPWSLCVPPNSNWFNTKNPSLLKYQSQVDLYFLTAGCRCRSAREWSLRFISVAFPILAFRSTSDGPTFEMNSYVKLWTWTLCSFEFPTWGDCEVTNVTIIPKQSHRSMNEWMNKNIRIRNREINNCLWRIEAEWTIFYLFLVFLWIWIKQMPLLWMIVIPAGRSSCTNGPAYCHTKQTRTMRKWAPLDCERQRSKGISNRRRSS